MAATTAAAAAAAAAIAEQERLNRVAAGYYGIAVACLVAIPVLKHGVGIISGSTTPPVLKPLIRPLQRISVGVPFGDVLCFPIQIGLAIVFVGLNIGLVAWEMDWHNQAYLGSRTGWIALINMLLTIFLGLKNTPLSILAAQTYRDLNALHRFCGYTTVLEVVLHGSLFSSGLYQHHASDVLRQPIVYAGAVSGIAMLLIAITASSIFRKRFYEAFYILHIILVVVVLVAMGLHQPWISTGALIVTIIAACLWVADRAIRFVTWARNAHHGYCTITPLPLGATLVTLHHNLRASPGSHAFLWIPSVRLLQQHPFSLLNDGQYEVVVAARKGFTKDLYDAACKKPGMRLRASLGGAYGITPDLKLHNKCLMIAGGSGATFALSLAQEWLRITSVSDTSRMLHFVWVVRSATHLEWLSTQLHQLKDHPRVNVTLHVTGSNPDTKDLADGQAFSGETSPAVPQSRQDSQSFLVPDLEKAAIHEQLAPVANKLKHRHSRFYHFLHHGRPVIDNIFRQALGDVTSDDRLLVTGSGPARLLTDIRAATAEQIKIHGPSVKLHIEEYEW